MAADPEQSKGDTPSPLPTESTSTLAREGSLTPQWLQTKSANNAAGAAVSSGMQQSTRPRLTSEAERLSDNARRARSESFSENETLTSKPRGYDQRARNSKWAPDDRETWKAKERWAAGPDSSKRWLEVPVIEGWGTDPLLRSHGDRWNTEGGRWTEERRPVDDQEYVPKNSKWNDEERGERWRTSTGRSRGQTREQGPRRMHSDVGAMSELNGDQSNDLSLKHGHSASSKRKYTRETLAEICEGMKNKVRSHQLPLPTGLDPSHQELLKERKTANEMSPKKRQQDSSPVAASSPVSSPVDGIGPEELEADSWVYKDPSGQVQGPFSKQEVLAWWAEGYFPLELPVQSQLSAKENWVPIKKLLKLWNVPLKLKEETPAPTASVTAARPVGGRKLEGCDSLVTVGSHISSSLLPDVSGEIADDFTVASQPQTDSSNRSTFLQSLTSSAARTSPRQMTEQNPQDLNHSMQSLMLNQQKQAQQTSSVATGLSFTGNPSLGASGLAGLRPGLQFQQNNPLMNAYALQQQQQQQLQTGLQENSMLSPQILEALQRTQARQQGLNRHQMHTSPYGFDMNSTGLGNPLQNQLQSNPNLAALLAQNQLAQRNSDPRITSELQRILQARQLQSQNNAFGALNNQLGTGIYNQGLRAQYLQQQQQTQQNPWAPQGQVSGLNYNALNSLLQQQQQQQQLSQQLNPQQQMARAMLYNKLQQQQGLRLQNQQMGGVNPTGLPQQNRDILAMLQGGDQSMLESLGQNRQRNNMSPPNPTLPSPVDLNFSLTSQSATPSSLPPFNFTSNQRAPPFPQHILHHVNQANADTNAPLASTMHKASTPPILSLDSPHHPVSTEEAPKMSPTSESRPKNNAWGISQTGTATASLLEIQEQESKTAMQSATMKEKPVQTQNSTGQSAPSWNVQHVKPIIPLVDIMQEDAETQRQHQAQAKQLSTQQQPSPESQGTVWSKKARSQSMSQSASGGDKGSAVMSKERSAKEEQDKGEGFWNLDSSASGPNDVSRDLSHDSPVESEVHLFSGQLKISQQFREWCKTNMIALGGPGDIALIEFLLSLKSRSEIAEYIQEYFKDAPSEKLSVFISEFMKRKDNDAAQSKKERGGQKSKKKTSKQRDNAAMKSSGSKDNNTTDNNTNPTEVDTVSSGTSEFHGLEGVVGKVTSTRTRDAKAKLKTKKQAKGQHIPADMLGFKSNVNFGALYRDNSNG